VESYRRHALDPADTGTSTDSGLRHQNLGAISSKRAGTNSHPNAKAASDTVPATGTINSSRGGVFTEAEKAARGEKISRAAKTRPASSLAGVKTAPKCTANHISSAQCTAHQRSTSRGRKTSQTYSSNSANAEETRGTKQYSGGADPSHLPNPTPGPFFPHPPIEAWAENPTQPLSQSQHAQTQVTQHEPGRRPSLMSAGASGSSSLPDTMQILSELRSKLEQANTPALFDASLQGYDTAYTFGGLGSTGMPSSMSSVTHLSQLPLDDITALAPTLQSIPTSQLVSLFGGHSAPTPLSRLHPYENWSHAWADSPASSSQNISHSFPQAVQLPLPHPHPGTPSSQSLVGSGTARVGIDRREALWALQQRLNAVDMSVVRSHAWLDTFSADPATTLPPVTENEGYQAWNPLDLSPTWGVGDGATTLPSAGVTLSQRTSYPLSGVEEEREVGEEVGSTHPTQSEVGLRNDLAHATSPTVPDPESATPHVQTTDVCLEKVAASPRKRDKDMRKSMLQVKLELDAKLEKEKQEKEQLEKTKQEEERKAKEARLEAERKRRAMVWFMRTFAC
jgi:hypothetical protein